MWSEIIIRPEGCIEYHVILEGLAHQYASSCTRYWFGVSDYDTEVYGFTCRDGLNYSMDQDWF